MAVLTARRSVGVGGTLSVSESVSNAVDLPVDYFVSLIQGRLERDVLVHQAAAVTTNAVLGAITRESSMQVQSMCMQMHERDVAVMTG